ncbi:MAG TPA: DUF885 domain-containing protein [Casimicrobiaceae bacterium]|nr:DUF885 domain-containing protein [Casimicrobiaceae bacterium]
MGLIVSIAGCVAPALAQTSAADEANAIFAEYWERIAEELPEYSTFRGDDRYNDRLTDWSPEAIARRRDYARELLARVTRIDADQLSGQTRVSLDVLRATLDRRVRVQKFDGSELMPVSPMTGPQLEFSLLVKSTRFQNTDDYRKYLRRLAAFPQQLRQIEALLRRGLATGWVLPAQAIQNVPAQMDAWLTPDINVNPAGRPFVDVPAAIPAATREQLAADGRRAIADDVAPAFRALKTFFVTTYMPGARKQLGASTLPDGAAYYDALIADQTTTTMTAADIHALGLREVARIDAAIVDAIAKTGFRGTRDEFYRSLHESPQFYYTRADELLTGYRDIAKRADAELPSLFAQLPRLPYGIRAMEAFEGENADHYTVGSEQGARAGFFEANTNNLRSRPKYEMENVFLHEAVPGHHLQTARAQELAGLPEFRKHTFIVAYVEGWALYAESLGDEMGFYRDPYSKFGQLAWEMVRACRLVIDTGIHALGWERQRAIDYLVDHSGITREFATAEVDRYIVQPGQALGYKLGELRIKALRAKAAAALGERFNIRRFHNAVIDDGALPLDVLEQRIDAWIAAEKARS